MEVWLFYDNYPYIQIDENDEFEDADTNDFISDEAISFDERYGLFHNSVTKRAAKKNKCQRNLPRSQECFLYKKKQAHKMDCVFDQNERRKAKFWETHTVAVRGTPKKPTISPVLSVPQIPSTSSSSFQPPVQFTAPNSEYERELQAALKASALDNHVSGISNATILELSSRELTPEDYEMLLLLDKVIEKKTVNSDILKSLNETIVDESTTGNCPICCCDFELGEKIKTLNCTHSFHVNCVTEWLTNHSQSCPLCNAKVT